MTFPCLDKLIPFPGFSSVGESPACLHTFLTKKLLTFPVISVHTVEHTNVKVLKKCETHASTMKDRG